MNLGSINTRKRMFKNFLLIISGFVICRSAEAQSGFISVHNGHFNRGTTPYYFVGTNYWYGGLLALNKDQSKGIERLRNELDFLKLNGINNVRVLAGSEGKGPINGVVRVGPALQVEEGVFDPGFLKGMDNLLYELDKRHMTAVIYLSNNWNWSGGFLQYLKWNGMIPDSVFYGKTRWSETGDYTSKFYSCDKCIADYLDQVRYVVSRVNSITQRKYVDDPAIMAWEIANEPRPMCHSAVEAYRKFIAKAAAFIKGLDHHHLVTTGTEGYMSTDDPELYKEIHTGRNIDYLTIHIWPKNWSWFKGTNIRDGMDSVITRTVRYLKFHENIAASLHKPLVVEEFGLPRDDHSYDINAPTILRDLYYKTILTQWEHSKNADGILCGVNFWAYGGEARPIPGQVMWKEGDPYMGDPPMEEQGLNSVFNSDASTWNTVDSFSLSPRQLHVLENLPSDKLTTKQTVNLYHNLKKLENRGIMFGHQDDLAYGVGWKYIPGKSDVKEVTGDYPAVYGFELGRIELDHQVNIDSVPFDSMRHYIQKAYTRGGVITLSWHLNNPMTGKTAWDPSPGTVASILPGGSNNEKYTQWLDKVANFILSLQSKSKIPVPVILRLFHEWNGNWFWWGRDHCTPAEFKAMWHYTVAYLRDTRHIHQLLYAFNTDRFHSTDEYLSKYPGDDWADVLGFDIYQRDKGTEGNNAFIRDADTMLSMLDMMAFARNKIPAMTEFGFGQVPDSSWWTSVFLKALDHHIISYVLAWRNAGFKKKGPPEYYLPYKGQLSEKDFVRFYKAPGIIFQKQATKADLYQ
jgi:mannan endo-1,4-beta-mannosidase